MKTCPNCNQILEDADTFCTNCGTRLQNTDVHTDANAAQNTYAGAQANANNPYTAPNTAAPNAAPVYASDPYDHTYEFDTKDISDNKVMVMALYLLGTIGILIALLAAPQSPYVNFHLKQVMKFTVTEILMAILCLLLCWTFIVPLACLIMFLVLGVVKIICFFQVCSGKAKEPAVIRSLSFLK